VSFEDPRVALRRHGLHPRKSFGQNFLVDPGVLDQIVSAVGARPGLRVIEIGAGVGTLTRALAEAGAEVVAIERDRDLVPVLRLDFGDRVRIEEANAVTFDYRSAAAGAPTVVAGNLPYQITAPLLAEIMDAIDALEGAVVMVQKEVADRLAARVGTKAYGALSVLAQARAQPEIVLAVPPRAFHPPPQVHSAVVRLRPLSPPRIGDVPWDDVRRVVRAAFSRRRKQLKNALAVLGPPPVVEAALAAAVIDPTRRPETLGAEEFAALARALSAQR
jgi:16S rRNA (adenine1518-N6/adenine1519-N6)-dimethyltransferase